MTLMGYLLLLVIAFICGRFLVLAGAHPRRLSGDDRLWDLSEPLVST
ncbi:MAG: hypothetical protein U0872_02240 [Planctomycetaceae bacterium]